MLLYICVCVCNCVYFDSFVFGVFILFVGQFLAFQTPVPLLCTYGREAEEVG